MKKMLIALSLATLLSACAGSNKLAQKVAFELGEDPSNVQVTNVKMECMKLHLMPKLEEKCIIVQL